MLQICGNIYSKHSILLTYLQNSDQHKCYAYDY